MITFGFFYLLALTKVKKIDSNIHFSKNWISIHLICFKTIIFATDNYTHSVMNLLAAILITIILVFAAVFLLGFRIFSSKEGKFPNIHIGGSKALKDRGVSCATTQDSDARKANNRKIDVSKIINEIDN